MICYLLSSAYLGRPNFSSYRVCQYSSEIKGDNSDKTYKLKDHIKW